jgi:IS30 family transposase
LIKGAGNRSSVGTLVERTTGFVGLAKMDNATTKAVVDSFAAVLNRKASSDAQDHDLRPGPREAWPQNPH